MNRNTVLKIIGIVLIVGVVGGTFSFLHDVTHFWFFGILHTATYFVGGVLFGKVYEESKRSEILEDLRLTEEELLKMGLRGKVM